MSLTHQQRNQPPFHSSAASLLHSHKNRVDSDLRDAQSAAFAPQSHLGSSGDANSSTSALTTHANSAGSSSTNSTSSPHTPSNSAAVYSTPQCTGRLLVENASSQSTNSRVSNHRSSLPPLITQRAHPPLPPLNVSQAQRKRKRSSSSSQYYEDSPQSTPGTGATPHSIDFGTPLSSTTPVMSPGGTFLVPDSSQFRPLIPLKKRRKLLTDHTGAAQELEQKLQEKHHHLDHDERMRRVNSTPSTPSTPAAADTPTSSAIPHSLMLPNPKTSSPKNAHKAKSSSTKRKNTTKTKRITMHPARTPNTAKTPSSPSGTPASLPNAPLSDAQLHTLQHDVQRLIQSLKSTLGDGIKRGTVKKRETLAQKKILYSLEFPMRGEHITILLRELNTRLRTSIYLTFPTETIKIREFYSKLKEVHPDLPWRKLFSSDLPPTINEDFAVPYRLAALLYTHLYPEQTSVIYTDEHETKQSLFSDTGTGIVDDQKLAEKAVCCHCLLQLIPGKGRRGSGNLPRHKKKTCRAIGLKLGRESKASRSTGGTPSSVGTPTSVVTPVPSAAGGTTFGQTQTQHNHHSSAAAPSNGISSVSASTPHESVMSPMGSPVGSMVPLNGMNAFMSALQMPNLRSHSPPSSSSLTSVVQQ